MNTKKTASSDGVLAVPPFFASVPEATNGKPIQEQKEAKNALRSFSEEGLHRVRYKRMFYAYISRSERDSKVVYHGFTRDLKKRLEVHNSGGNRSTSAMKPWRLVWYGAFETEATAMDFERYLKTASGKAFARKRLLLVT